MYLRRAALLTAIAATLIGARLPALAQADLDTVASKCAAAATAHDAAAFAAASGRPEKELQWLRDRSTESWRGGVLAAPDGTRLVVIHAWHACEGDGDHVYPASPGHVALAREIPEGDPLGMAIVHHDLAVTLDPNTQRQQFTDDFQVVRKGKPGPWFILRLNDDFHVTAMRIAGSAVQYSAVGGTMAVATPAADTFTIHVEYSREAGQNVGEYMLADEAVLNSYWYPHIARLPCTETVRATVPAGWTAIGQGDETSHTVNADGTEVFAFDNKLPNCFFSLDAARFTVTTRQFGAITLRTYLRTGPDGTADAQRAQACLDVLQHAMEFYQAKFGGFPYDRYSIVETKGPFPGALEAYSFATYQTGALPGAIPHELAHSWWGGRNPCRYLDSMWDESFATYSDGLFEQAAGRRARRNFLAMRDASSERLNSNPWTCLDAHNALDGPEASVGYGKGSTVLQLLADEIGEPAMIRSMRRFLAAATPGEPVEWVDFERAVAAETGRDLAWFFHQWLGLPGYPVVAIGSRSVSHTAGTYEVSLSLDQPVHAYRLRMPVHVALANGRGVDRVVVVDGPHTTVRIRCTDRPVQVTLDPAGTLPLTLDRADGTRVGLTSVRLP